MAFDSPDRYGKGLDWTGYTVHDAANILRRYFNQLPEPIIPLDFYERFRQPLRNYQAQAVGAMDQQSPDVGTFDPDKAIRTYQALITELPPLNRQLLLYILDLLAVFASKSDMNKMTTPNLAAIFQPGLLSHPQHAMAPKEYRLSQDVLIFLIENQDSFLIGMHGTAADEKTVKEVQSGAPTPALPSSPTTGTPGRSKTTVNRSSSIASVGGDNVGRWGNLKRNVSVSSRGSRQSGGGPSPGSPAIGSPSLGAGGVHRSNTVPSKRSAAASPRFTREKSSDPTTPIQGLPPPVDISLANRRSIQTTPNTSAPPSALPLVPEPAVISASSSEGNTPTPVPGDDAPTAVSDAGILSASPNESTGGLTLPKATRRDASSERSFSNTPSTTSRTFLDIFKQSPAGDADKKDGKRPNKLQKKRIPGSALSSAQTSAQDLGAGEGASVVAASPVAAAFPSDTTEQIIEAPPPPGSAYATAQTTPRDSATPSRRPTDLVSDSAASPPTSHHSHASVTDVSDADFADEGQAGSEGRRHHRWFSQPKARGTSTNGGSIGMKSGSEHSRSRVNSTSTNKALQSSRELSPPNTESATSPPEHVTSDNEEKKKGPMSWIRGKLAERKEKDAVERGTKASPSKREGSSSRQSHSTAGLESTISSSTRGKSIEVPRQASSQLSTGISAEPSESPEKVVEEKAVGGNEA